MNGEDGVDLEWDATPNADQPGPFAAVALDPDDRVDTALERPLRPRVTAELRKLEHCAEEVRQRAERDDVAAVTAETVARQA